MHNPFAKPHTSEQWLLSSAVWIVACLTIWVMLTYPLVFEPTLPYEYKKHEGTLLFISFIFPYAFGWKKASPMAEAFESRFALVNALLAMWMLVLYVVLMAWLCIELFLLAFSGPSQGGGWFG